MAGTSTAVFFLTMPVSHREKRRCAVDAVRPQGIREMIKKTLDLISFESVAAFLGVVVWLAKWGEGAHGPGHWSIQSKILVWDAALLVFGVSWLIVRYANGAAAKGFRSWSVATASMTSVLFRFRVHWRSCPFDLDRSH